MIIQQVIEQNVRTLIGDLQVQLIVANARITELEQVLANIANGAPKDTPLPNGKMEEHEGDSSTH